MQMRCACGENIFHAFTNLTLLFFPLFYFDTKKNNW